MSEARLIRAADGPQVVWKNGGGTTREIAAFPTGAGMTGFAWRLSAARVDRAGAFSHFAAVDRTIAILSGRLRLEVAGRDPVTLTPDSAAYAFAGDIAASGTPIDGAVLDLNLMVRRGSGVGAIRALPAGPIAGSAATAVLVARQRMTLGVGGHTVAMEAFDAFRLDPTEREAIVASQPVWMVSVVPRENG